MLYAIVPIKHLSERVPGKNYRIFNGKPLFRYIIETLLDVSSIDGILINTDSPIILNDQWLQAQPKIKLVQRPKVLQGHTVPVNQILEHMLVDYSDQDLFFQTHTTNPLLSSQTIEQAITIFLDLERRRRCDSLYSVKRLQTRLYRADGSAVNHNPNELLPTQDLDPIYEENSCMYLFRRKTLFERHHRIGNQPYLFEMTNLESQDIDVEYEFTMAEILHRQFAQAHRPTILITGANGGIGSDLVRYFQSDYRVIATDVGMDVKCDGCEYIQADLTDEQDVVNLAQQIDNLDIVIHAAAIQVCKPIWQTTSREWDRVHSCNLKSVFWLVKYLKPYLEQSSNPNVITIGSVHGLVTSDEIAAYASAKAGLVGLTRNLAIELAPFKIRVNTISPGAIDTPMLRAGLARGHAGSGTSDELVQNLADLHLLKQVGTPRNVSLLTRQVINNQFINGANLVIDGGAIIKLSTE